MIVSSSYFIIRNIYLRNHIHLGVDIIFHPLPCYFSISFPFFGRWPLLAPETTCLGDLQRPSSGDSRLDLRSRAAGGTGSGWFRPRSGATAMGCWTWKSYWWREDWKNPNLFFVWMTQKWSWKGTESHVEGVNNCFVSIKLMNMKFFQSNNALMIDLSLFWYVGSIDRSLESSQLEDISNDWYVNLWQPLDPGDTAFVYWKWGCSLGWWATDVCCSAFSKTRTFS